MSHDDLGIAILARAVRMSERTLQRELSRILGVSPSTWVRERRLEHAAMLLAGGHYRTIGEVAAAVGMSRSYFSRAYRAWCGRSPSDELPGERAGRA
jgi:AraC-like DNA-binding protein